MVINDQDGMIWFDGTCIGKIASKLRVEWKQGEPHGTSMGFHVGISSSDLMEASWQDLPPFFLWISWEFYPKLLLEAISEICGMFPTPGDVLEIGKYLNYLNDVMGYMCNHEDIPWRIRRVMVDWCENMTGVFVDGKWQTIYGIHTDPSWVLVYVTQQYEIICRCFWQWGIANFQVPFQWTIYSLDIFLVRFSKIRWVKGMVNYGDKLMNSGKLAKL